jgi:hypothetical protein
VSIARSALICDFSATRTFGNELQQAPLGAGDAHNKAPILVAMLAAQRNCSFAIDQSCDVRSIPWVKINHSAITPHAFRYRKE